MTSASPSITTFPDTKHSVFSNARRFSRKISLTRFGSVVMGAPGSGSPPNARNPIKRLTESEKSSSARPRTGDGVLEPCAGVGPVSVGGGPGQAEGGGRVLDGQPGEVPQFDHTRGDRVFGGEPGEGRIEGEQSVVRNLGFGRDVGQLDPRAVAAVLLRPLAAGVFDEDAAHGLGRGGEEVPAVVELLVPDEPQIRFVNQRGRLKGVPGLLLRHAGSRELEGSVVPLIEMGAGFEQEMTGRYNIKLSYAYRGKLHEYSKEAEGRIIEFSGLSEKIDLPLKTYSSGMLARLAFSSAIFQHPDILLLDEIFAAGDAGFIEKARGILREKVDSVASTIMVSHDNNEFTDLCNRFVLMHEGRIIAEGARDDILDRYRRDVLHIAPEAA